MDVSFRRFERHDIEGIDDTALYRIWLGIGGYIQDASNEDSLTDGEREELGKAAETVVDALAAAPRRETLGRVHTKEEK